ncbi:MAG: LPP20 family lipoprotein [Campylobacterales bacterium]|nr:LPP20 family lipoprotein [Campylobacterales bacterium]
MKRLLVLIGLGIGLIAGENVPSWYFNPPSDNEVSWYGVGEGNSLRQAKDSALADIASKLSVTISSKVSKDATQTTSGAFSSYHQNVNVNQESEVKKMSFNNFEVISTSQNDSKALVLVQVDKAKFLKDQLQTLTDMVKELDTLQLSPKGKSILEEYQEFKSLAPDVEKAKTIISILTTFDVPFERTKMSQAVSDYRDSLDAIRSQIEFYISADNDSHYSADVLKEALAAEKIKIVQQFNRNNTNLVIVDLDTVATSKQLFSTYMVNTRTTVSLKSKEGAILSTFIVESRGNSSIDYATALKNASNNFKQQVNEKGIFTFLGIN